MVTFGLMSCMVLESPKQSQESDNYVPPANLRLELESRQSFLATPISFAGQLLDKSGQPVAGAVLNLQEQEVVSDNDGRFYFAELSRQNDNLLVTAMGFRSELFPVQLSVSLSDAQVVWPPLPLEALEPDVNRLYFAGDVAMGRRFLELEPSPPNVFPTDDPSALISVDDPVPGSIATVQWMKPYFEHADGAFFNLESPVTRNPEDPHPTKEHVFFTLPESLSVLPELGIDFVSLGNNHVYDYQEKGLDDTIEAVESFGVMHGGAGQTPESAWAPVAVSIGSQTYTVVSASTITGDEHEIQYVATEEQGGAANLQNTEQLRRTFEEASNTSIGLFHTGEEYSNTATDYSLERAETAIESGADLIISHHPHVTQHWANHQDVLAFHSLGNFIFDQERVDTMLAVVAEIDVSDAVVGARALPVYVEDFRPRPVTGSLASQFLMDIALRSESHGVSAITAFGRSWIDDGGWEAVSRSVESTINPDGNGVALVDLRPLLKPGEMVIDVVGSSPPVLFGSDILQHGDFEDHDVDNDIFEASRWDTEGESRYVCTDQPHRGVAALCSFRDSDNVTTSTSAFRHRIRLPRLADGSIDEELSIFGYRLEASAGASLLNIEFYASTGSTDFGSVEFFQSPGGSSDWSRQWADLAIPVVPGNQADLETSTPGAIRISIEHQPPDSGAGRLIWDDLAVVHWQNEINLSSQTTFLRFEDVEEEQTVTLFLERYERSNQ